MHVRVKVGYIDRHTYVIVVMADTCTFKDKVFSPTHVKIMCIIQAKNNRKKIRNIDVNIMFDNRLLMCLLLILCAGTN